MKKIFFALICAALCWGLECGEALIKNGTSRAYPWEAPYINRQEPSKS
ncbi:MAG: hypothetical protein LBS62_10920 [Clostridiales bacterium]|jgi:hypothetical protein|nr:hypothetical protein [Clostridiales bacterium]